ncbi:uncharacterized protein DUF3108 [Shimia isoporae]|uniref:Uncharacterized protein DUF3108 n=1 Tax=Shimia isoporae TaxID=647720 RepID=A0A4R1NJM6_9RHOB|nr:DUF3108 domain-containing protein [Shimia isoporae]TCL08476.1 uncharacterized protein DUF3108 [Shimia isoporae]
MRHLGRAVALGIALLVPSFTAAAESQLWSVRAFGVKIGELQVKTVQSQATYRGDGSFQTTGLAGVLKRIRFSVASNGRVQQSRLLPLAYTGFIDTGRRISETKLGFTDGLPTKIAGEQSPETPISNTAKQGAIDPMTMMWLTVRDQTAATLCNIDQTQFDGTRLVRITLKTRNTNGNMTTCSGTYDRIGGYSAEELAELKTSPLAITYTFTGDRWRATEIALTSRHGKARLLRQD